MTSVSAGHIILTPTQPVGSGWSQRGSNPQPPNQESRDLPTELPRAYYHQSASMKTAFEPLKHSMKITCTVDNKSRKK